MQDIFDPSYTNLVSNNSVEILPPTEANKKIKYVNANKKVMLYGMLEVLKKYILKKMKLLHYILK